MTKGKIGQRHLTVVVCAAGQAADVATLVEAAQHDGWSVGIVATPQAVSFIDVPAIETLTGRPIRSEQRIPDSDANRRDVGHTDAIIVAPATFNTINKLAAGVADNYALTLIAECVGIGIPVVVVPFVNTALASRVPYIQALDRLRAEGLQIIGSCAAWTPHPPGTGEAQRRIFPWIPALHAATRLSPLA